MKRTLLINFITILLFTLFYQSAFLSADAIFFDSDGNVISKEIYEEIASNRDEMLSNELSNGYRAMPKNLKDPIKLKEKRIEQWRMMRLHYNTESLPSKIENQSKQN